LSAERSLFDTHFLSQFAANRITLSKRIVRALY